MLVGTGHQHRRCREKQPRPQHGSVRPRVPPPAPLVSKRCRDPATAASPFHPIRPGGRGLPVPAAVPCARRLASYYHRKSRNAPANLPAQPCYKSGSGGSAVRQSLPLRAPAPNVLPGTLNGDAEESCVARQRLGPAAHPGVAALPSGSPGAVAGSELRAPRLASGTEGERQGGTAASPGDVFSPRAALALPLTSANVVKSLPEPIFRASHHMRFLHRETGNADEVVRHGAAFSSPVGLRAPLICLGLPRHRPPRPPPPGEGTASCGGSSSKPESRESCPHAPSLSRASVSPKQQHFACLPPPRSSATGSAAAASPRTRGASMHWHRARGCRQKDPGGDATHPPPHARCPRHGLLGASPPSRFIRNALEPKRIPAAPSGTGPSAGCHSPGAGTPARERGCGWAAWVPAV